LPHCIGAFLDRHLNNLRRLRTLAWAFFLMRIRNSTYRPSGAVNASFNVCAVSNSRSPITRNLIGRRVQRALEPVCSPCYPDWQSQQQQHASSVPWHIPSAPLQRQTAFGNRVATPGTLITLHCVGAARGGAQDHTAVLEHTCGPSPVRRAYGRPWTANEWRYLEVLGGKRSVHNLNELRSGRRRAVAQVPVR
jgi:hypothetical protein